MFQPAHQVTAPASAPKSHPLNLQRTAMTGWIGRIVFAAVMVVMLGTFHAIQGFVALFEDEYVLVAKSRLTVHVAHTTWGWIHLIGGIIIVLTGLGLFTGKAWARAVGVLLVMISTVVTIGFIVANPTWCTLMIAVDLLVIWALTVHGAEVWH